MKDYLWSFPNFFLAFCGNAWNIGDVPLEIEISNNEQLLLLKSISWKEILFWGQNGVGR